MTTMDYAFPLLLVLSVLRQIRGKHLTPLELLWPLALVSWAAVTYVRGFPPTGPDLILVTGCGLTGVTLGVLAGRYTQVFRRADGAVIARATAATVVLWTLGAIGRLVFALYAEHGGGPTIAAFSHEHALAAPAWTAALTLMALAEVLGRTLILTPRALTTARTAAAAHPQPTSA